MSFKKTGKINLIFIILYGIVLVYVIVLILGFQNILIQLTDLQLLVMVFIGLILMSALIISSFPLKQKWNTYFSKGRRKRALAQWAKSKDLDFSENSQKKMSKTNIKNYSSCAHCTHFGECYAFNIISGNINTYRICAFDYYCYADNGIYLSTVVIETNLKLEALFIRPHCFLEKIADSTRLSNIDFESIEFNKEFHVFSPDRRWAYDVINQSNMELLLSSCRFNIEFLENHVIAYRNRLFESGHFEEALQLLIGILDNLPKTVVRGL